MSITPRSPDEISQGKIKTWVSSQWKFMPLPGQISVAINRLMRLRKGQSVLCITNNAPIGTGRIDRTGTVSPIIERTVKPGLRGPDGSAITNRGGNGQSQAQPQSQPGPRPEAQPQPEDQQ